MKIIAEPSRPTFRITVKITARMATLTAKIANSVPAMNKHSISINGHRTSYSLEPEFYSELEAIARKKSIPLARLITSIDKDRNENTNLSSALRIYILNAVKNDKDQATG